MSYDAMNPFGNTMQPQALSPVYNTQPMRYYNPQDVDDVDKVNGINGAWAFPTKPNSRYALFDENNDRVFIKKTDSANYPTITRYKLIKEDDEVPDNKYVTVEEFNKFKEDILSGKQHIRTNNKSKWNGNERDSANKGNDANAKSE